MTTDALNRRLRFASPSPVVRRLVLTERDYLVFEAINRHGPLPAHYLFEFTRHEARSYKHLQNRLTELYNGDPQGGYLVRPPQQFAGFEARYQHVVYDLGQRAKIALAEQGRLAKFLPRRTDPFLHQLMGACVGASFELTASRRGLRYISREDILAHPRCPDATRSSANPLAVTYLDSGERKTLIPDDLFGIEYPGAGYRFFAVEIDRNTESIERRDPAQNAVGKKIIGYLHILEDRACQTRWGIPNLHILVVTTNAVHGRNILEFVRKQASDTYADKFAMACEPSFGINWRVPRTVLEHLVETPWSTPVGVKDFGRPR